MNLLRHKIKPVETIRAGAARPVFVGSMTVLAILAIIVIAGPILAPGDPLHTDLNLRLAPPSIHYPMGNDALGRCLMSRLIYGARISVGTGLAVVLFSCVFGTFFGLIAGYAGGIADEALMRVTDMFLAFPEMIAAIALAGIMGPGDANLVFAISCVSWTRYARVARGITLTTKEMLYVKAARLAGVPSPVIVIRHIFPAAKSSMLVLATVGVAKAILAVSALGFLGFGVQPPNPEWGTLLMEGKDYLLTAPHLSIFPGLCIMLTVMAFNLLGDELKNRFGA